MKTNVSEKTMRVNLQDLMNSLLLSGNKEGLSTLLNVSGSLGVEGMTQTNLNGLKEILGISIMTKGTEKIIPSTFQFKVTNELLMNLLLKGKESEFDKKKHITVRGLGYETIYKLNKLSKKRMGEYIKKGGGLYYSVDQKTGKKKYFFDLKLSDFLSSKKFQKTTIDELKLGVKMKKKREVCKGGKYGKVEGFNFYFGKNEKLKPFERKLLLEKSEEPISEVFETMKKRGLRVESLPIVNHLDSKLSDFENVEIWNYMYNNYGYLMTTFKNKWEKERLKGVSKEKNSFVLPNFLASKKPTMVQGLG
jgi:hypothetical protein